MKLKKLLFGGVIALGLALSLISTSIINSFNERFGSAHADDYPALEDVFINGVSFASGGGNPYHKHGDTEIFTGDSENYDAHYDASTGTLILNGYNGGPIKCASTDRFTVNLNGADNVINASGTGPVAGIEAHGIVEVRGSGNIEINVTKTDAYDFGAGIYALDTVMLTNSSNYDINMGGVTVASAFGVISEKQIAIFNAHVDIDIDTHEGQDTSYGVFSRTSDIMVNEGHVDVVIGGVQGNRDNYGIYCQGNDSEAYSNGNITISNGSVINLTKEDTCYAKGIGNGFDKERNTSGYIVIDDSEVNIDGFAYGIISQSAERAYDTYDLAIRNGAEVNITTEYDGFGKGLVSRRNGILINGADYSYDGCNSPITIADGDTFTNKSKYGLHVEGESHVDLRCESAIRTYNGGTGKQATSVFDLEGDGYFDLANREGTYPLFQGNGWLAVKLESGTRWIHETHFVLDGRYGVTDEGGIQFGHYGTYENDTVRFEAISIPLDESVSVNQKQLSAAYPYYVNGAGSATDDPEGYNAYMDYTNGVLYLDGYEGGEIYYANSTVARTLRIVVVNDSTITATGYGIDVRGPASLEISSSTYQEKVLTFNVTRNSGDQNVTGISVPNGNLYLRGKIKIKMDVSAIEDNTGYARGLYVGFSDHGNVYFEDESYADISISSVNELGSGLQSAIHATGQVQFNSNPEYRTAKFSTKNVAGKSYTIFGNAKFNRYTDMTLEWSGSGGATYTASDITNITNGAVNVDTTNKVTTIKYGTPYHLNIVYGTITNAASGNFVDGGYAAIQADSISGVQFKEWVVTGTSVVISQQWLTGLTVHGNDTVTATYTWLDRQPNVDTRGSTTTCYLDFKAKGTPDKVFVVEATGDETDVVVEGPITKDTSFTTDSSTGQLKDGQTYRLCGKYGAHYLFSDPFTVNASAPAYQYAVTYHHGAGTGADYVEYANGDYNLAMFNSTGLTAPEGQRFKQWENDATSIKKDQNAPETVYDVFSFTAIYEVIPDATVTFVRGEHATGSMDAHVGKEGDVYTLPTPAYVADENYHFAYWLVESAHKAVGETIDLDGDISITAIYEEDPACVITFSAGEGSGSFGPVNSHVGHTYALPAASTFEAPEHKVFKCWRVGETDYDAGTVISLTEASVTVTAIFEYITHEVSFNANGGSGTQTIANVNEGSSYSLPNCTFVAPEGKEFDGWMIGETRYEVGASITVNEPITVKANWKDAPVTPTDNPNQNKGLSGGAIAGIVVGSVVVGGIGIFALVWFVILKKSFGALVSVFKKK